MKRLCFSSYWQIECFREAKPPCNTVYKESDVSKQPEALIRQRDIYVGQLKFLANLIRNKTSQDPNYDQIRQRMRAIQDDLRNLSSYLDTEGSSIGIVRSKRSVTYRHFDVPIPETLELDEFGMARCPKMPLRPGLTYEEVEDMKKRPHFNPHTVYDPKLLKYGTHNRYPYPGDCG